MSKIFSILKELFTNRFFLFGFFCVFFVGINFCFTKTFLPTPETKNLWFYSGLFMVVFSTLFIEPYYTSPKNVITNAIPLFLVLLAIKDSLSNSIFWWSAIIFLIGLILISGISILLNDKNKSPDHYKNKITEKLKNFSVLIGQGRVLYSAVFIYFLLSYYSIQDFYTLILFVMWAGILAVNPKNIKNTFAIKKTEYNKNALGEIVGVQSKKIFLVKLFEDRTSIKKFDIVKFRYSMQDADDLAIAGIVFDTYFLNQEKQLKILQLGGVDKNENILEKNIVYKISDKEESEKFADNLKINDFIGVIIEGSKIEKIKFEYSKKQDDLQEGDLLELKIGKRKLFYQVVGGKTEKEKLEAKNETGFIEGEAIQLGEWQDEKFSFQKFGWLPSINTPIFKADTSKIKIPTYKYPDYKLGVIPNTKLPSIINLNEAVSHHMALLGVTGSGKSFLAREIIKELNDNNTKVICVDFNNEFVQELKPQPESIISKDNSKEVFRQIGLLNNALVGNFGKRCDNEIANLSKKIFNLFSECINKCLDSKEKKIIVFELSEISNNRNSLDYTRYFFDTLFKIVRDNYQGENTKKISIVLEEAHTIIPEWNFTGTGDKTSQSLINNIGQIALQGRKYGIGFLVIAQRTANVSKTVLTQCNTVICFQAFDETSFKFLGNYVGKDLVQTLPNLKQYHAIVTGKAIKSNIPMIVDLTRKNNNKNTISKPTNANS